MTSRGASSKQTATTKTHPVQQFYFKCIISRPAISTNVIEQHVNNTIDVIMNQVLLPLNAFLEPVALCVIVYSSFPGLFPSGVASAHHLPPSKSILCILTASIHLLFAHLGLLAASSHLRFLLLIHSPSFL